MPIALIFYKSMQGWLLGDFSKIVQGHYEVITLFFRLLSLTYLFAHRFTVIGMGEEMASSLGLSYAAIAAIGLILVAITVSTTVITVGAIPFVGSWCPIWSH